MYQTEVLPFRRFLPFQFHVWIRVYACGKPLSNRTCSLGGRAYEFLIGKNRTEVRSSRGGKRVQVTTRCEGCQETVPFVFFCVEVTGGGGQCWARADQTTEEKCGKSLCFPGLTKDLQFYIKCCYVYNR